MGLKAGGGEESPKPSSDSVAALQELPPEPAPTEASEALTERFAEFFAQKEAHGKDFNRAILARKDFRNPRLPCPCPCAVKLTLGN